MGKQVVNHGRARSRGQVLVIFALSAVFFVGLCAVVVDVAWYWANTLRVQRAADAAALAGAVLLPADVNGAVARARAEATKNGYTTGGGVVVTPCSDINAPSGCTGGSGNDRQLDVRISAPVSTFFMRVFGITSINATRSSKAEYVLPVPMGSPENYYGVFGTLRGATFTQPQTTSNPGSTGLDAPSAVPSTTWTTPLNANGTADTAYAVSPTGATNTSQQWRIFNNPNPPGTNQVPAGAVIDTIQVEFRGFLSGSGTSTACKVDVALSPDAGATWSSVQSTPNLNGTKTTYPVFPANPPNTDTSAWGSYTWKDTDFSNANFRLRLSWGSFVGPGQVNQPTGVNSCATTQTVSVDTLKVNVSYHTISTTNVTTTTNNLLEGPGTACPNGASGCFMPDGAPLNQRGFWGTMNTEGASNVNGDAYQPYWDTAGQTTAPTCTTSTSGTRSCYGPDQYYNYAIEMPPGSTGGYVYVFDPGFCYTDNNKGTGDRWFTDGSNTSRAAISSWYELLDTNNTAYDLTDDGNTYYVSSGTKFMNMRSSDSTMVTGTTYGTDCKQTNTAYNDGRDYHDAWYLLNPGAPLSGGVNGTVYRLHTTGTDPRVGGNPASQQSANGEQSFSLYMTASGGTGSPRIYGLGAMQMFTPLKGTGPATSSEFYLAQIDGVHEGKTVEVSLWDPGDTCNNPPSDCLAANLQILVPDNSGYGWSPASLDWRAVTGTSNGNVNGSCATSQNGVSSVVTAKAGQSLGVFNGCWLTIDVKVPIGYATTCGGSVCQQGWWRIRYNMTGTGTSNDVTTWKVTILGNPVHLKVP